MAVSVSSGSPSFNYCQDSTRTQWQRSISGPPLAFRLFASVRFQARLFSFSVRLIFLPNSFFFFLSLFCVILISRSVFVLLFIFHLLFLLLQSLCLSVSFPWLFFLYLLFFNFLSLSTSRSPSLYLLAHLTTVCLSVCRSVCAFLTLYILCFTASCPVFFSRLLSPAL